MTTEPVDPFEPSPLVDGAHYEVGRTWEDDIEKKIGALTIEVHLTALGTLIAVGGIAFMARTVVKLIQTQGQIASVLSSAGLIAPQPTEPTPTATGTPSAEATPPASGVKYARPEKRVDTTAAGPVDPQLLGELDSIMKQDPTRDTI
jgi:hypothetical protein